MLRSLTALAVLGSASLGAATTADPIAGKKPNIVFVLTDDQGYGDISAHGNPILKTPNLDKLHAEGVRFTDLLAHAVGAPDRAARVQERGHSHDPRARATHPQVDHTRPGAEDRGVHDRHLRQVAPRRRTTATRCHCGIWH